MYNVGIFEDLLLSGMVGWMLKGNFGSKGK